EAPDMLHLEGHVVLFRLRAELDLLRLDGRCTLARLLLFLRLFVLVLAVIHDPADRRERARRDLDDIEPPLLGESERFVRRHDAELLLVGNDANLGNANPVVDAKALFRAAAVETSSRSNVHGVTSLCCMFWRNLLRLKQAGVLPWAACRCESLFVASFNLR